MLMKWGKKWEQSVKVFGEEKILNNILRRCGIMLILNVSITAVPSALRKH